MTNGTAAMTLDQAVEYGLKCQQEGAFPQAEHIYRQVLQFMPDHAVSLHLLGVCKHQQGAHGEAEHYIRRALDVDPAYTHAWCNLGSVQLALGDSAAATGSFTRALQIDPALPQAHNNLANVYRDQGMLTEAERHYQEAIRLLPAYAEALVNLGALLAGKNRLADAISCFSQALVAQPHNANAYNNMGVVYMELNEFTQALQCFDQALKLGGNNQTDIWANKGATLLEMDRPEEAAVCFAKVPGIKPDFATPRSNALFRLHYQQDHTAESIYKAAVQWAEEFAPPSMMLPLQKVQIDPDRPLRIGYVSANLHNHPIGYFMESIWQAHDSTQVEIFVFANQKHDDDMTLQLKSSVNHWRNIAPLTDEEAIRQIRDDRIDILIDLSGHTGRNRLRMFAQKPAPIQITWLGYFGTTGLQAMDYILADSVTITPEEEAFYTEKPLRLPENYLCFTSPKEDTQPGEAPREAKGHIIFACFGKIDKMGQAVWDCWAEILQKVPNSRMKLRSHLFGSSDKVTQITKEFTSRGVTADRIDLLPHCSRADYLAGYRDVDIVLDTFPYAGGTTTAESLWMGVPVVTLKGKSFAGRIGPTILHHAGLGEWVTGTQAAYVAKAIELAKQPSQIPSPILLRNQFIASSVCDAPRFAANLEQAFRKVWRDYCAAQKQ